MQSVSRQELEGELRRIEQNDAYLASGLSGFAAPISIVRREFLRSARLNTLGFHLIPSASRKGSRGSFRRLRAFAFLAGGISLLFFLSFFVEQGLSVRKDGNVRSVETYAQLRAAEARLKSLDFTGAAQDFKKAYENVALLEKSLQGLGGLVESRADSSIALLTAAKHIASGGEILSSAIVRQTADFSPKLFENQLSDAELEFLRAEYEMRNVDARHLPPEFAGSIADLREKLPALFGFIGLLKDYSKLFAPLLGAESTKTYLVVFQNSSELRPTGGFIGSYALIEIQNGKFKNTRVEGIYDADGQLTENVIPPKPLQHITSAWSTHDANWFLDFPTSAEKIIWFFEHTGAGYVDGVISLNVEVVEQLLALTGPISLPSYNVTLDQQNFRDEIQYEVEAAYDKKLNRPKQILSDFAPIFFEKLSAYSKSSKSEILSLLFEALEQKYLMFYFKDKEIQDFFETQGWSGNVKRSQDDYLAVVHSNIGGYKTDKFMKDKIKYEIVAENDGILYGHVTVERTHTGGGTKYWWYNKENVDYVKIYVPKGSEIISYSGGIRRTAENKLDYAALSFKEDQDISTMEAGLVTFGPFDIFAESGKTVLGTWLVTKPKKTQVLEVRYKLPFRISFIEGAGMYNLYFQKQPGTKPEVQIIAGGNLASSFVLDKDKIFSYTFKEL